MFLALTYDHRLLDGREAVTFLVKVLNQVDTHRIMKLTRRSGQRVYRGSAADVACVTSLMFNIRQRSSLLSMGRISAQVEVF